MMGEARCDCRQGPNLEDSWEQERKKVDQDEGGGVGGGLEVTGEFGEAAASCKREK
jgi:hypothetical protein